MIECFNLTKKYGEVTALNEVNLKIDKGEFVCLVGPSGAGKSTLVRLLIREELPTRGKILIAGRNIAHFSPKELPFYRRKIGVVFQEFKLLSAKTVWENVSFALEVCEALPEEIERRVPKILDLVGLSFQANQFPDQLSGGEKQRVSLARALVHSPKILIADEPTGNLDPVTSWEIIELLDRINRHGTLVLLATHNKSIVDRLGKRVILIRKGKIISDQLKGRYLI